MNTIEILREDFSHIIKKADVWLVFTTKSNRPWICIPNGITYTETTLVLELATVGGKKNG